MSDEGRRLEGVAGRGRSGRPGNLLSLVAVLGGAFGLAMGLGILLSVGVIANLVTQARLPGETDAGQLEVQRAATEAALRSFVVTRRPPSVISEYELRANDEAANQGPEPTSPVQPHGEHWSQEEMQRYGYSQ